MVFIISMNWGLLSTRIVFIDELRIFVDKFTKLIDMIVFVMFVVVVLAAALFLRGEGGSFGNTNVSESNKKKISTSDKNYFL